MLWALTEEGHDDDDDDEKGTTSRLKIDGKDGSGVSFGFNDDSRNRCRRSKMRGRQRRPRKGFVFRMGAYIGMIIIVIYTERRLFNLHADAKDYLWLRR